MRRLFSAAAALAAATFVIATPAGAANVATIWTLIASPGTVSTGVTTEFTLVATNGDLLGGRIQCMSVDVPINFDVLGATAGSSWTTMRSGNTVRIFTGSGGNRLDPGQSLTFAIGASARSGGSFSWPSRAYERQDCTGTSALLTVPPVVVVLGPVVAPSPSASASPRPTATPAPTVRATAPPLSLPTLPPSILPIPMPTLPLMTLQPSPSVAGSTPVPSVSKPVPTPSDQAEPSASPATGVGAVPGGGGKPPASGGGETSAPAVSSGPGGLAVAMRDGGPADRLQVSISGDLDVAQLWFVPAAVLGGPGLLVLLWVGLQVLAGLVWLPAARRLRGDDRNPGPVSP
jgi:hypothetical protein